MKKYLLFILFFTFHTSFGQVEEKFYDEYLYLMDLGYAKKNVSNEYDSALFYFTKAIAFDSLRYKAYDERAHIYEELGDYKKAIGEYSLIIELPRSNFTFFAYYRRAYLKYEKSDFTGALLDFDSSIAIAPWQGHSVYVWRGHTRKELKDYKGAMEDYDHAISIDSDTKLVYAPRADLKEYLGDFYGAIIDYTKEIELNPNYWHAYAYRGHCKREIKDYKGAIRDYTSAFESYSKEFNQKEYMYLLNRANVNYLDGNYTEALKDFNTVAEDDSSGYYVWRTTYLLTRGKTKVKLKDYEGAINDFTLWIDRYPMHKNEEYHFERGLVEILLNEREKACEDFQEALKWEYIPAIEQVNKYCH